MLEAVALGDFVSIVDRQVLFGIKVVKHKNEIWPNMGKQGFAEAKVNHIKRR